MDIQKFSDFAEEAKPLDGDKIKLDSILNHEVAVTGYRITRSKYGKNSSGKCLTVQVQVDNCPYVFFTGSDVLIDQFEKYGDMIPFLVTFKRIDRFYTMT